MSAWSMAEHADECDCTCTRCHDRGCVKCDPEIAYDLLRDDYAGGDGANDEGG